VKFFNIGGRGLEAGEDLGIQGPVRRLDLPGGGFQVGDGDIIFKLLVLPPGFGVAVPADGRQNGGHRFQDGADVFLRARQDRLPPPRGQTGE
jgi:hypothetical protein